jgi:cysteine desulfurase
LTPSRFFFDHNAGASVLAAALEAAIAAARAGGNPSSVHAEGRAARKAIDAARAEVAGLAGVLPANVVFTSGATEANAFALSPRMKERGREIILDRLLIGATEHPSVLAGGRFASDRIERIAVDGDGLLRLDRLAERLEAMAAAGERGLVSVQLANSETGVIQSIAEIARLVHASGHLLHCDAVQAAGRVALDDPSLDADLMSLSAHKIGGLPGVGALVARHPDLWPEPLIPGGGQEAYRRAGTQNTLGIVAFGVAATVARGAVRGAGRIAALRDGLEAGILARAPGASVLGAPAPRLPNTTMVLLPGVSAETAVIALDLEGLAVSAGSACSSGKVGPSHVVEAMGHSGALARSALRFSLGAATNEADMAAALEIFGRVIGRISRK